MQVSDIVRRVRDAAGDLAVLQFSQTTLTDWINDGVRECVIENSLLQTRATSATEVGVTEYALPDDIFKLHSVYADGYKLEMQTLEEWEQTNAGAHASDPVHGAQYTCYVYAGVLNVWPTPDAVVPLVINYTKLPPDIVYTPAPDTWVPNTPAIPSAFHNHIVVYCLAQVALQDDDMTKYQLFMGQFKSGVIDLARVKDQTDDLYPTISISVRDAGDGTYG